VTILAGDGPIVLVAPHGGRRDPARRPWSAGHLRMNDLHTAALTAELAASTGAAGVVNAEHDRNDVDLNRISDADGRAPWFLEALADTLRAVLTRHTRAIVLAVHGWNVVQPAVDLGLGCAPGPDPFAPDGSAAVGPEFAANVLPRLVDACRARGIGATVGARYPARHRENLVQLFGPRYAADARPRVRLLAELAPRVDAMQLELGIPLRWPGPWRTRFVEACVDTFAALTSTSTTRGSSDVVLPTPIAPRRLQFAGAGLCGLVATDAGRGGRLLLFPPEGGLVLFTGERLGLEPPGASGRLRIEERGDGSCSVRFAGPLLRFPDTTPFLDLEAGLARAELADGDVAIDFTPFRDGGGFGAVVGRATIDGTVHALGDEGFADDATGAGPWPRLRVAVRVADGVHLAVSVGLAGGATSGFVCRHGRHVAIVSARAVIARSESPLDRVTLEMELADGERLVVATRAIHRLPVIRARGAAPVRFEFAACGVEGPAGETRPWPAGWLEAGGL
jgi:hypothetical protein